MAVTPAYIVTGGGPNNELPGVPGYPDNSLPGSQPGIDNSLPRHARPVDPGYGIPLPPVTVWPTPPTVGYPLPIPPTYPVPPPVIDNSPPTPPTMWPTPPFPPTTWPPPQPIRPGVPVYPTTGPVPGHGHVGGGPMPGDERPDAGLPGDQPGMDHELPGGPPGHVGGGPMPGGERPSQGLPMPPGSVWPPLPGIQGPVIALVWFVGYGYRWGSFDPSLSAGMPLPGGPPGGIASHPIAPGGEQPDQSLPWQPGHADQELPPHAQPR